PVPLGDLPEDARAWERGVDELAAEDSEVADYVRALEEAKDLADAPEASGDAIAREFERYLRRRGDGPGQPPLPH
ncbi:MAG: PAC2 family protein, partial [Actinomycetes bacterium]